MAPLAPGFGEMKAKVMVRLLERRLGYTVVRRRGSHRIMKAPDRPQILFAYHDNQALGPSRVRDILVQQAGLSLDEAKEVYRRG